MTGRKQWAFFVLLWVLSAAVCWTMWGSSSREAALTLPAAKAVQSPACLVPPTACKAEPDVHAKTVTGDNLKVAPGLVQWHARLSDACTAAAKSGKPVLLFQMMGKLDDRFC